MGVNIKQATYCGPKGFGGTHGDPGSYIPESGKPQPLLDTSNSGGVGPGVHLVQATYCGPENSGTHGDQGSYIPSGASIPTGSTDVQNPESHGTDQTPRDIFRSPENNG
jgi:hypothetical protein